MSKTYVTNFSTFTIHFLKKIVLEWEYYIIHFMGEARLNELVCKFDIMTNTFSFWICIHILIINISLFCHFSFSYCIFTSRLPFEFEGILPKGAYLPCVSMAGRALLAGYHWIILSNCYFYFPQTQSIAFLTKSGQQICANLRSDMITWNRNKGQKRPVRSGAPFTLIPTWISN